MTNRYLPAALRRALEKTAKDARVVAEDGARDAIRRLGIADSKAPAYLRDDEKELRRRLRAHARALGDVFDKNDETQGTKRLVEAAAYAHWHRMLFARFLAERGLLRNPEYDVPVSLEDCRELAEAEGLTDPWAIAERYAASMLPAVFRIDDPVLALQLDPVHTQKLHRLVTGLDAETFQAEDSLGWTYQFWRAAEKQAVNDSGVKIGADELPAVTQLFTESYMVRFLLHNTLGAWWAGKVLAADQTLARTASDEGVLRTACSVPDYSFDMLRFVRDGEDGHWRPAAGNFPGWPEAAKEITMLDPCCGSGHFLTEALAILAALRKSEEHLAPRDAVLAVLRNNLYGLEIDGRCVQIATFAVALNAWRIGGWQELPIPHIAWVGAPPPLPKREFMVLADGDIEIEYALGALHDLFAHAPILGTLLEPTGVDLFEAEKLAQIDRLFAPLVEKARRAEPEVSEGAIAARGMADAAVTLRMKFTLVATNVPFLTQLKFSEVLNDYTLKHFPTERANLATCMIRRSLKLCSDNGAVAILSPQSWWFLKRYTNFRDYVLDRTTPLIFSRLGENAFWSPQSGGEMVGLSIVSNATPADGSGYYGIDIGSSKLHEEKQGSLVGQVVNYIPTKISRENENSYVYVEVPSDKGTTLGDFATALVGATTGDAPRFIGKFWEFSAVPDVWSYFQSTVSSTRDYGGMTDVIRWESESGDLYRFADSVKHLNHIAQNWRRGKPSWGRLGISVSMMGNLAANLYTGEIYDSNCCAIIPRDETNLLAIWNFCREGRLTDEIRGINQNRKVEVGTILSTPFDPKDWVDSEDKSNGFDLPSPYSVDPTQWLFHGHPANTDDGFALHVGLARLAGYQWPAEKDTKIKLSEDAQKWIAKAAELPAGDNDGLLGIPPVAGEKSLADRLRAYLSAAFGGDWSDVLERRLVAEADGLLDKKLARDGSLEAWVRDRAFRQHCALFGQRPFLWHITDGLKDGFSVFVHYHRFDQANLRKLTYTLLGDWLARAKAENSALRYEKGRELQQTLEKVLEGEKPCDIFVRWKSLAQQPFGWDPDLDDGVRQNIRPFIEVGLLGHDLSKIMKDKDRGNDIESAPWHSAFNGERRNDHHTTLAEKRAAREEAAKRVEAVKR